MLNVLDVHSSGNAVLAFSYLLIEFSCIEFAYLLFELVKIILNAVFSAHTRSAIDYFLFSI